MNEGLIEVRRSRAAKKEINTNSNNTISNESLASELCAMCRGPVGRVV